MLSLEEKAIAAVRNHLLSSNADTLIKYWNGLESVKGGNEDYVFDEMLARDILAYTALRYVFLLNGYAFGGFIPAHYSGKPWTDLDILINGRMCENPDRIIARMLDFIVFTLTIDRMQLRCRQHLKNHYANSYDIVYKKDGHSVISFKLDLSFSMPHKGTVLLRERKQNFLPVTIGRCLALNSKGVEFRKVQTCFLQWSADDIVTMLKAGKDIMLCCRRIPHAHRDSYRAYFWYRTQKIRKHWALIASDEKTPDVFTEAELQEVIRRMTSLVVARAS